MKKYLFILAIPLLTSCATWKGRSDLDLIKKFGVPDSRMESNGGEIYQYVQCDQSVGPVFNAVVSTTSCAKRLFLVKDHVVVEDMGTAYH